MRLLFIFSFIVSLLFSSKEEIEANIDAYKKSVDKKFRTEKLVERKYTEVSRFGFKVKGYYENGKLILIKTRYDGGIGYHTFEYFIRNDSLLFVTEEEKNFKEFHSQEEFLAYEGKHTDRRGNINLANLTPIDISDNQYYMQDTLMMDAYLKGYRKSKVATQEEIEEKNKIVLDHYRLHLLELK